MESVYTTPLRTPSTKGRRRALSPSSSTSPFQVVNLELCDKEQLKNHVIKVTEEADELKIINNELREGLNESMNNSLLIETSNRIRKQEIRVHSSEVELLESENRAMKGKISTLEAQLQKEGDKYAALDCAYKSELRKCKEQVETLQLTNKLLNQKNQQLDDQIIAMSRENSSSGVRENSRICALESRIQTRESQVKELTEKVADLKASLEEARIQKQHAEDLMDKMSSQDGQSFIVNEIRTLHKEVINTPRRTVARLSRETKDLIEEIGALRNKLETSKEKMDEMKQKEETLIKELEDSRTELSSLKTKLTETEGGQELTHKYLVEETEKVRQQKADIRCQLLQRTREYEKLKTKIEEMEKDAVDVNAMRNVQDELSQSLAEQGRLERENTRLGEKVKTLEESIVDLEQKISLLRDELEVATADKKEKQGLQQEITQLKEKLIILRNISVAVDSQCEQYRELKKKAEAGKKAALDDVDRLIRRVAELEKLTSDKKSFESEVYQLRLEKDRLTLKNRSLMEELKEAHSDYRDELARLAREQMETKHSDTANKSFKFDELEQQLKERESEIKTLNHQISQLTMDNTRIQEEMKQMRVRENTTVAENGKLLQGLSEAVEKIEKYKKESMDIKELNEQMAMRLSEREDNTNTYEDEVSSLQEALQQKERLVEYLQSQVNAKQLPKVSRRSTLLRTISDSSMNTTEIVDPEIVEDLENQKSQLIRELEEKKRRLNERKEMPPPAVPRHHKSVGVLSEVSPNKSCNRSTSEQNVRATQFAGKGTMRHDIPHRWKDLRNVGLFSIKCAVCFAGVSAFGKARKCAHCHVIVHPQCSVRVVNTCGLPDQCANYYLDKSTAPMGAMNGWIKLFCDDGTFRDWQSAWALMDKKTLKFFDSDTVNDLSKPFISVDLENEQYLVRAGAELPVQLKSGETSYSSGAISVKLNGRIIYMLAPSLQSAKRWTEQLQAAQTRRMVLTRKPSSFTEQACLVALTSPNNLTVHTTAIVDDYLILGAKSGLFFTSVNSPRIPLRIGGVSSVTALEIIPELNIVVLVIGSQRSLALLPLNALKSQMCSNQPAIRPDTLTGFDHIHLLKSFEYNGSRFIAVANPSKIQILKHNVNRDVFTAYHTIDSNEPAMCIEPSHDGFFFGSDSFYFVDMASNPPSCRMIVESHVADYPISVMQISADELLIAYQNHGEFVSRTGYKTRKQTIEWEQMPMEFVYTAPYLYVMHYDCIEIMKVAPNVGPDSQTVNDERELFECQNAHIVSKEKTGDVYISISNKDSTEIHRFNAINHKRQTFKRKGISLASLNDKRSKVY